MPLQLALLVLSLCAGWRTTAASMTEAASARAAPGAVVQIRNGARPGSLEVWAARPTELAPDLIVERQMADGSFAALRNLDLASLRLVESCGQPSKTCVTVDKRGLHPAPWSGMSCSSQCNANCDRNVQLHGRFRFVVRSCDGRTRFEGPVFTL